jgi:ketosteroid isomerase-like protein
MAIGLIVAAPPVHGMVQEATPAVACRTTTPEENKELVRRWFAALSTGTGADLAALAAADVIYHDPSPQEAAQTGGADAWASNRQQDYPDLTVTVEQVIAEGDMVASYQRYTGTKATSKTRRACRAPAYRPSGSAWGSSASLVARSPKCGQSPTIWGGCSGWG